MPWIAPSHQAPVLPLKRWKPHLFSGLALCLGAAAPDLEFILRVDYNWIVSHTFAAQLYFTTPLVMLLHAVLTSVVLPWLLPLLPGGAPLHLHDLAVLRPAVTLRDWWRVALSGFVGGVSHVLVDGICHGNHTGWALPFLPVLRAMIGPFPLYDVLHVGMTVVFGAYSLRWLAEAAGRRDIVRWSGAVPLPVREASAAERRGAGQYMMVCAMLGLIVAAARRNDASGSWYEIAAHGVIACTFYGIVAAALLDRIRQPRTPRPRLVLKPNEAAS